MAPGMRRVFQDDDDDDDEDGDDDDIPTASHVEYAPGFPIPGWDAEHRMLRLRREEEEEMEWEDDGEGAMVGLEEEFLRSVL